MNKYVTIIVSNIKLEAIKEYYKKYLVPNSNDYVSFMAKYNDVVITGFDSKKIDKKVTFVGQSALEEAKKWDEKAKELEFKKEEAIKWVYIDDQIGSDEVGTGDFLLPMIVVSAFVRKKDIPLLKQFGVTDSKKLTDKEILEIGDALKSKFFFSKLTLTNEKYNEMIEKGENLNSLKAKMHNCVLLNLFKKFPDTKRLFIDEFCSSDNYFNYLKNEKEVIKTLLTFHTKGESYYPSVALASVMARYSLLKEKEKLDNKYHLDIPFGAGIKVDKFVEAFLKKYSKEELDKLVKKNFKNYKAI